MLCAQTFLNTRWEGHGGGQPHSSILNFVPAFWLLPTCLSPSCLQEKQCPGGKEPQGIPRWQKQKENAHSWGCAWHGGGSGEEVVPIWTELTPGHRGGEAAWDNGAWGPASSAGTHRPLPCSAGCDVYGNAWMTAELWEKSSGSTGQKHWREEKGAGRTAGHGGMLWLRAWLRGREEKGADE